MRARKLTSRACPAHKVPMEEGREGGMGAIKLAGAVLGLAALPGCITVNAPDKPIVIELNINIQQEVLYRIASDVESTIQDNADIF